MKPIQVLFLAGPGPESEIVYHALKRAFAIPRVFCEAPRSRRLLLQRRLRRLGIRKVLGQLGFQLGIAPFLRLEGAGRIAEILASQGLEHGPINAPEVIDLPNLNTEEARRLLRRSDADVVVINGTSILSRATLDVLRAPILNTHVGITPHYRGVHGGYWALRQGDRTRFGVTVHLVDPGIDTGLILGQTISHPSRFDNFATYPYVQLAAGIPLLEDIITRQAHGELHPRKVNARGTPLWSHPTALDYLKGRFLEGVR